jgi:hypothetical protein
MLDRFLEYASRIIFLQKDVADLKSSNASQNDELIEVRNEIQTLALGLQQAMHEIQRLHDRLDHESKQTQLQIENAMLKSERRLPANSSASDDNDS